jgi:hypothetical protein
MAEGYGRGKLLTSGQIADRERKRGRSRGQNIPFKGMLTVTYFLPVPTF